MATQTCGGLHRCGWLPHGSAASRVDVIFCSYGTAPRYLRLSTRIAPLRRKHSSAGSEKRSGDRRPHSLRNLHLSAVWIGHAAAALNPAYFGFVMATGIVSNALFLHGARGLSDVLFAVNLIAYAWLWLLTALRAVRSGGAMAADLSSLRRLFLFFTTVAATDVLAVSVAQRGFAVTGLGMWLVALALWLVLSYLAFGVPMFSKRARDTDVIDGAWLDAVVATQSLVVAGGLVALPAAHAVQAYMALPMLWTVGFILYGILITLLFHRFIHSAIRPDDVTPPLWLVMGAAAISANGGAVLIVYSSATPFLRMLAPFLAGGMLAGWAWATWWIPLLVALEAWKPGSMAPIASRSATRRCYGRSCFRSACTRWRRCAWPTLPRSRFCNRGLWS